MHQEAPQALRQAIHTAPVDPMGDGKVTRFCKSKVDKWGEVNAAFGTSFAPQLEEFVPDPLEKEAFERYIAFTAITLANMADPLNTLVPAGMADERGRIEAEAAEHVVYRLGTEATEPDAFLSARDDFFHVLPDKRLPLPSTILFPSAQEYADGQPPDQERAGKILQLKAYISEQIDALLVKNRGKLEIRDMTQVYQRSLEYARKEIGLDNPPILNLTLGDVNLQKEMEPEFADVPYRMGLTGPKLRQIQERANAYENIMREASINYPEYDVRALGWEALRNRHRDYLNRFGLQGYVENYQVTADGPRIDGSALSYAGSDGLELAYKIARSVLKEESQDQNPAILFPTPGFMMVKDIADGIGIHTKELKTSPENQFLPDPEELELYLNLAENQDVKIFVLTPINNPASYIAEASYISRLLSVLEKHGILLINDLAYLGTGNEKLNRELGEALNGYKRRIDVLPDTKFFGVPGLRCGSIFTPDEKIAALFEPEAKKQRLAMSYPMQFRAMAMWDFVKDEDLQRLKDLYYHRQQKFRQLLGDRTDLFQLEQTQATQGRDGALYLWVPLQESVSAVDVIKQTGLFGTPAGAFYLGDTGQKVNYIRFALGVEPMNGRNLALIREALKKQEN